MKYSFVLGTISILLLSACTSIHQQKDDEKISVVASIYPLAFLAEQIGGEFVDVTQITPNGVEPHDYEPTAKQVAQSMDANLFFYNGEGVDAWAEKVAKNRIEKGKSVYKATGTMTLLDAEHSDEEQHEHEKESSKDPHIWLSPRMMQLITKNIETYLLKADPLHTEEYQKNADRIMKLLEKIDVQYKTGLQQCAQNTIVVSHDAFRYLAKDYALQIVAIAGLSPEEEPSLKKLADIARIVKEKGIRHIFFEELVSPKLAETLATEVGATTLVLNPLEGLTPEQVKNGDNYFTIMQQNLSSLRTALQCK